MSNTKRKPRRLVRVGETYGQLTVLSDNAERTAEKGQRCVDCSCSCGRAWTGLARQLTSAGVENCGCVRREKVSAILKATRTTHGQSRGHKQSKLYLCYENILKRCYDPDCDMYHRYGGRGITMCARWKADRSAFFTDMGEPLPEQSIDRIKNDRGYWCGKPECPECGPAGREPNCRWANAAGQANNKSNNRALTHAGRTMTLAEWSRETGIPSGVIRSRLGLGWTVERSLTEQVRTISRRAA